MFTFVIPFFIIRNVCIQDHSQRKFIVLFYNL